MQPISLVCEVSWEVCNKVGGIYTVVRSKIPRMIAHYGDRYLLIGPYYASKIHGEFIEKIPPDRYKKAFAILASAGIKCHFGIWLTEGEPSVVLIEILNFVDQKNKIKTNLWDAYQIDSYNTSYYDFEEPVVFSTAAGMLIEQLAFEYDKVVAQFHEWLVGAGLLYVRGKNPKIGTVFTTHATMLGRTLCSSGFELYEKIDTVNPDAEAKKFGIQAKHGIEKSCAKVAHVVSTVSEITALEAKKLLGAVDVKVLTNGLDSKIFPTYDELAIQHMYTKDKLKEFLMYYFFPYYSFDLDDTYMFFYVGRYEYHDKGIDVLIKALGQLNKRLKSERKQVNVVCFFWTPAANSGIRPELIESKTYFNDVKEVLLENLEDIKERILTNILTRRFDLKEQILGDSVKSSTQKMVLKFLKEGTPPLCTHNLTNPDSILADCYKEGLHNEEGDRVKIVYNPVYLSSADGLLNLGYYETMTGMNLGIFPSYYEPYGYTPLEAGALGVASVTSDLSGFGRFIGNKIGAGDTPGIYILERQNKSENEIVENMTGIMHSFCQLDKAARIKNRMNAKSLAALADWGLLAQNYFDAHDTAAMKSN